MEKITRGSGYLETFLAKRRIEIANRFIPESSRQGNILDIGCGSYPYFLLNTQFRKKYGVDQINNGNVKDIQIIGQDIAKTPELPFQDDYFDVITMLAVFEHIEQDKLNDVIKEIKRILKPEGMFIMTTPTKFADKLLKVMAKFNLVSPKK